MQERDRSVIRLKADPPRGVLKTAVADARRYEHFRYHPSADLEAYVEHYWAVRWDLRGLAPETAETLPHPSVHMIFGGPCESRIAGVARGKWSTVLEGEGGVFAVKFKPGGFHPFARMPVATYTDRAVGLEEVWGEEAWPLERAVLGAGDDGARIEIVEAFLRGRGPATDQNVARVAAMVYGAMADRSILSVDDLVERHGVNKRTLQRLFAKYVGVSPKWVIQRYRLHEAAEKLAGDGAVSQAGLASELGYSDQAHFVRDFKQVVGVSPGVYAKGARRTGEA